ncbi:MAG: deoxyribose-phosphate aldolase [Calditrichaeota bacterium]|nr:deoxyribose-phosphate aldolase [Calditrichota bacterium]
MTTALSDTQIEKLRQTVWKALKNAGISPHPPEGKFWQPIIVQEKNRRQRFLSASQPDARTLATFIDHTLLKPEAGKSRVEQLCQEAQKHGFAAVCVNPVYVPLASRLLQDSPPKICSVVGFPLGANLSSIKAQEARQAISDGATEIDMVLHVGALKDRDLVAVYRDIRSVVEVCDEHEVLCKVILETALLEDEEKVLACELSALAGAAFVKTSTGFGPGGATEQDVALMERVVAPYRMGVKASGGIRSWQQAVNMIHAGAIRIGASASVNIVTEVQIKPK